MLYCFLEETVTKVGVKCNSEDITITVTTIGDQFNGMIYPKGLSKNSTCMTPYIQANSTVDYVLPLRSCNTMNTDVVSRTINRIIPLRNTECNLILHKSQLYIILMFK